MVRPTITISSPHGSPMIIVFRDTRFVPKFKGGHPELGARAFSEGGVGANWRFSTFKPPYSAKRYKIRQRLLLITSGKSNTRFRLVPKSTTLVNPEMTFDGNYARCCITHVFRSQPL